MSNIKQETVNFYNNKKHTEIPNNFQKSLRLIEEIKTSMQEKNTGNKCLNLSVKLNIEYWYNKGSSIEIKIGEDRLYVVKNIRNFMEAYSKGNLEIEYGKGFTYDPKLHFFSEEDKEILDILQELYEADLRNLDLSNYYQGFSKFLSGKKAYLTDMKLKRFLKYAKNREIAVSLKGINYEKVKIIEDRIPLQFELSEKEGHIELIHKSSIPYPVTEGGEYLFFEGQIYRPDEADLRAYIPFYNEFKRERGNTISFDSEDSEKIASYIIPSLKKISSNFKIDENLIKNFYEAPLITKIYFDKADEMIMATVKFCYNELQFNPLGNSNNIADTGVLVRDVQSEINIVQLFHNYKFQKYGDSFINNEEEKIVDFLDKGIPELQESCEIYYSNSFKDMKIYNSAYYNGGIRLNDSDLLEFNFEIEGVDKKELKHIFEALKQKKKYYRLKKGGFIPLDSKEIRDIGNLAEYLDIRDQDFEKDKIVIPKYNSLYIDESIRLNAMDYIQKNKRFTEFIGNIREAQNSDFSLPKDLEKLMRKYQRQGFRWLKTLAGCGFGGILADEMGLGKTLQAIAFIASAVEEGEKKPSIVVAPTSLVYNWLSEIEKFYPELKTLIVAGSKTEREKIIADYSEYQVIITSYPLIRRDIESYKDIKFKYCFLDEAQQIKNPISINAKSVKELSADNYFALTGTPVENSLTELWSIFDFIMPGYLLSHSKFVKKYEMPIVKSGDKQVLEELNKHIRPFILRRLKQEVIKELPPKIEHKVIVEMTEEQKKVYAAFLENAKLEINSKVKEKGFEKSNLEILSVLTRLRQICCQPSVFIDNYEGESGKMLALDNIIEESLGSGHRLLVFSQFTSILKDISVRLNKSGIKYMYLDGHTKMEDRGEMVNAFNEGKGQVFLISLKAGGTGLNLTGADVVIHYDPWWNPAVEEQASDRAHRIGQKKTVEVIKLITKGTIEEKIFELQEKKKEIIKSVMTMDNSEEKLISRMSEEELREILSS